MSCKRTWFFVAVLASAGTSVMAQGAPTLSDSEISDVIHRALRVEIGNADLALSRSQNERVRSFADATRRAYSDADKQALSSQGRSNIRSQDNPISQSLADSWAERSQRLSKLSGEAFDAAYARNELAQHALITGALEATLIPAAKDPQIKSLLQDELALFQKRLKHAKKLADQFQAHTPFTPAPPQRDHE